MTSRDHFAKCLSFRLPCESVKTISGGKTIFTVKVIFYRGQLFFTVAVAVAAKSYFFNGGIAVAVAVAVCQGAVVSQLLITSKLLRNYLQRSSFAVVSSKLLRN